MKGTRTGHPLWSRRPLHDNCHLSERRVYSCLGFGDPAFQWFGTIHHVWGVRMLTEEKTSEGIVS